ncbi:MAG TPA: kynureninase [Bacillus bacterium]|uniref:kynureninase n=1 Tax=Siminovitchia fordii TaxID=254759 RepID=UPI00036A3110|nr:kynureninase [Siminovitchia fordii]HBZ11622.1 kynureninase [Bacillus sp. (in: firmicutes)]
MTEKSSLEYAQQLDREDDLKQYRDEFYIQPETIYFDGNSLGLLSKRAEESLLSMLESWKQFGIDGWLKGDNPWFYFSEKLGEKCAPLIGADQNEVIVTGSTTVNLHQILSTFFKPEGKRTKILADELNFPTDIYAIKSQLRVHGLDPEEHLIQVKSRDGQTLDENDIIDAMTDEVAIIVLAGVLYRSGQILDMERLTKAAHERGILIAFDLCHSIGSVPHSLSDWDVDFAFWCTYKHLNGGPGSVAGMYVNKKHFGTSPGLAGWFSSDKNKQFDMEHELSAAPDAGVMQMGTPHLLSAAPLLGSLSMFEEAGIEKIREKSLKMTDYMMTLIDAELNGFGFTMANPRDEEKRGGHIFLEHEEAARICKALKENNVIPDFRTPNGIRLAPVALYNTFEEVWQVVKILKKIMQNEEYKKFENKRDVVA